MHSTALDAIEAPGKSDRELVESAQQGNASSFEQLVQRHRCRLLQSMVRVVGCPMLAEDIVQDAFVRALRYIHRFECRSNFYTWLFRIALNCRRTYLKNRPAMHQLDSNQSCDVASLRKLETPLGAVERTEEQNAVRCALLRLKARDRRILILREYYDLGYRDIGAVLNLNLGTVRSRLSRARAALRNELTEFYEL